MRKKPRIDGVMKPVFFLNHAGELIVQFRLGFTEMIVGRPDLERKAAQRLAAFFKVVSLDRLWDGEMMVAPSIYVAKQEYLWKRDALEVIMEGYEEGIELEDQDEPTWPDHGHGFGAGLFSWE